MQHDRATAYRPDIDGLRAIAVLGVVGYHAAPSIVRGGYIGVDAFFVISGFLISSIILREKYEGCFSLGGFYARRIRRLFPALIVVLAATLLIGWYFLLPHEFRALGKHMAAGAAYFINFTLKREAGYFDAAADEKPLLHLWSLAVEEQFYIVWPLLLLAIRERRHLMVAVALITGASFALNLEAVGRNAASAFYLPQNRVWELSAGALLALFAVEGRTHALRWRLEQAGISRALVCNLMSCGGLALILGAAFGFDARVVYPGAWALIPTLGAVLLIGAGPRALVNRGLLAQRPMVLIGLISYSLYLWHWPLLSFRSILGLKDDALVTSVAVALAFALAIATYRFVETPFRRSWRPALPVALVAITLACGLVGFLSQKALLEPRLNGARYYDIGDAVNDWPYPRGLTRVQTPHNFRIFRTVGNGDTTLYLGDSNIEQYWPRIERLLSEPQTRRSVIFATTGGCPPVLGMREATHPNCIGFVEEATRIALRDDVKSVVIGGAWHTYFNNSPYYLEGPGGGPMKVGSEAWNRSFDRLAAMIREFASHGKSVWLVLNIPMGDGLDPKLSLLRSPTGATSFVPLRFDRVAFERTWAPIRAKLIAAASIGGANIINPMDWLCDGDVCPGQTRDGMLMYKDAGHLRGSFAREHATFIDQTLGIETGSTR